MHAIISAALDSQLFWGVIALILAAIAFRGKLSVSASNILLVVAWVIVCYGIYRSNVVHDWYVMLGSWLLLGSALAFIASWIQPNLPLKKREAEVSVGKTTSVLKFVFDEKKHRKDDGSNNCSWFNIDVENMTDRTIHNVSVKIDRIQANGSKSKEAIANLVGLTLAVADTSDMPYVPPKSSITLHVKDKATFEVARVCKSPSNHRIRHSNYMESHINPQTKRQMWQQRPHGAIPPGEFSITIVPRGDDAIGEATTFEFGFFKDEGLLYELTSAQEQ